MKNEKDMRINQDEINASETMGKREEPDLQSDAFGAEEQKKIVEIVLKDAEAGHNSQNEWLEKKKLELLHLNAEPPSRIENISKKAWQSDRNLGLMPGVMDIYQATLLSTCYNPDSLHFVASESSDVDNRDKQSQFAKWGLGQSEANFFPEVDDYIANKTGHGFSVFKIYWEVKYQWVDKRIPVYGKQNPRVVIGYEIETEKRRFERGVIKNVANIDDILLPSYGDNLQDLDFLIEITHNTINDFIALDDMGQILNFEKNKFIDRFRAGVDNCEPDDIRHKKLNLSKFKEISNDNLVNTVIDMYEWYGWYEKNGKREKYKFIVEPISQTLMYGKPVRKLNRSGKIPYVGGPLRRIPGMLRGNSLTLLIAPLINALNNNYNQTSDFQYLQNMPFGFANLSELNSGRGVFDMTPGIIFNVDSENIQDKVYFPNLSRSLAWSYQDKEFLMQMIERLTGAASYFLTTDSDKATATRDAIVNEKSETKFGLWVKRLMSEICEAVNMWLQLYQDNAPRNLGERILGEDGKNLFKNFSIDDLRGMNYPKMIPDITHGSKAYEQKLALWGLTQLSAGSIWLNPQINPRGNWKITQEAMKKMGYLNADDYLPPMPKGDIGSTKEVADEFIQLKQGETLVPTPEGTTPAVMEHYYGHMQQRDEKYNEIPEEYRPNFDAHLFATYVNFMEFARKRMVEDMANKVAQQAVGNIQQSATNPAPVQPMNMGGVGGGGGNMGTTATPPVNNLMNNQDIML